MYAIGSCKPSFYSLLEYYILFFEASLMNTSVPCAVATIKSALCRCESQNTSNSNFLIFLIHKNFEI